MTNRIVTGLPLVCLLPQQPAPCLTTCLVKNTWATKWRQQYSHLWGKSHECLHTFGFLPLRVIARFSLQSTVRKLCPKMETKPAQNTSVQKSHIQTSRCGAALQVAASVMCHTHHSQLDAPSCHCERCRTAAPASAPCTHTSPGRRSVCSLSAGRTCRVDWPGLLRQSQGVRRDCNRRKKIHRRINA